MDNKMQLQQGIRAYDFAIWEMTVFLDTHPDDAEAIKLRDFYKEKRGEWIAEYEKQYGPYITTSDRVSGGNRWVWIDSPWPWEYGKES